MLYNIMDKEEFIKYINKEIDNGLSILERSIVR